LTERTRRSLLAYLPAAAWAVAIALLAGATKLPDVPATAYADKLGHFGVYFVLGGLLGMGWLWSGRRPARGWLLLFAMLLGAREELRHAGMPDRSAEVGDWIADTAGAAVGLFLASRLFRGRSRPGRRTLNGDDD
jgi:VanZ family protein